MRKMEKFISMIGNDHYTIYLFHGVIPQPPRKSIRNYNRKHILAEEFEWLIKHLMHTGNPIDLRHLLWVCDEGKSPPVFHEYDDLVSGWTQDIEFEGSFRCYATQLENLIISVDGSTAKKVGGDRKGTGTFSWKPNK